MAALIPLLMQLAPGIISGLPDIVKNIGHVVGKTIEGVQDVISPKDELGGYNVKEGLGSAGKFLTGIRTVNGSRNIRDVDPEIQQQQAFDQGRLGIDDNSFVRNRDRTQETEYDQYERRKKPAPRRMVRRGRRL